MKKVLISFLIGLLVVAILAGVLWGVWAILYETGVIHAKPLDFAALSGSTVTEPAKPTAVPAPEDLGENHHDLEDETYEAPTEAPTAVPVTEPVYTLSGNQVKVPLLDEKGAAVKNEKGKQSKDFTDRIIFQIDGEWTFLLTFEYHGGYNPNYDPHIYDIDEDGSKSEWYGLPIYGKTKAERIYNWLRELVRSGHQIIRLRTQMGLISPKSLEEENELAEKLNASSAEEYDKVANETLQTFYTKLYGGYVLTSKTWTLENYLGNDDKDAEVFNLHGRTANSETQGDDELYAFFPKRKDRTFMSSERGFLNTVNDAKAKSGAYSQRAWVDMDQGGTWKWKPKGDTGGISSNNSGGSSQKTTEPTVTPAPTSTPRPNKKNSEDRPKVSDVPNGGGSTNSKNSENPHTTTHAESTKAPEVATATPAPTAEPTTVPTAVVEHTPEVCQTTDAPLIRQDAGGSQSSGDANHNVAGGDNQAKNDNDATGGIDSFNAP